MVIPAHVGQLFETLCQVKTLAGASIEDWLNTHHETDLFSSIRILKARYQKLLCHTVFGFSLCSSLSQTLDWYAGSSLPTIWQLWFAEARKSFEMDRKWSNFSVFFSKTRPCFGRVFLAGLDITTSWHQGAKGDCFAGTGPSIGHRPRFGWISSNARSMADLVGSCGRGSLIWPAKGHKSFESICDTKVSRVILKISRLWHFEYGPWNNWIQGTHLFIETCAGLELQIPRRWVL